METIYNSCENTFDKSKDSEKIPKTIEELKEWYEKNNLPDEKITRFFIGKNLNEKKVFGIYKSNNGNFIVYKNKNDGSRVIRYEGLSEEKAVKEFYLRLKAEIANQKEQSKNKIINNRDNTNRTNKDDFNSYEIPINYSSNPFRISANSLLNSFLLILFIPFFFWFFSEVAGPFKDLYNEVENSIVVEEAGIVPDGFYSYNGNDYFLFNNNWYIHDLNTDNWLSDYYIKDTINSSNFNEFTTPYSVYSVFNMDKFYNDYYGTSGDFIFYKDTTNNDYNYYMNNTYSDTTNYIDSGSWDSNLTDFESNW